MNLKLHQACFCQSSNFSEYPHRNFLRDSEVNCWSHMLLFCVLDHGNLLPLYVSLKTIVNIFLLILLKYSKALRNNK